MWLTPVSKVQAQCPLSKELTISQKASHLGARSLENETLATRTKSRWPLCETDATLMFPDTSKPPAIREPMSV